MGDTNIAFPANSELIGQADGGESATGYIVGFVNTVCIRQHGASRAAIGQRIRWRANELGIDGLAQPLGGVIGAAIAETPGADQVAAAGVAAEHRSLDLLGGAGAVPDAYIPHGAIEEATARLAALANPVAAAACAEGYGTEESTGYQAAIEIEVGCVVAVNAEGQMVPLARHEGIAATDGAD